jgi:hypothetical protein
MWPTTQSEPITVGWAGRGVNDGAVLDRGSFAHDDVPVVASQHRSRPHRRLGADADVADDHRIGVHIGGGIDGGLAVAQRVDRH